MRWIVIAIVVAVALPACGRVNTDDSAELSVARAKALVAQSEDKLILNDLKTLSVGRNVSMTLRHLRDEISVAW